MDASRRDGAHRAKSGDSMNFSTNDGTAPSATGIVTTPIATKKVDDASHKNSTSPYYDTLGQLSRDFESDEREKESKWTFQKTELDQLAARQWQSVSTSHPELVAYRHKTQRLYFGLATGEVASYLHDPKKGKIPLFKQRIPMSKVKQLFQKPLAGKKTRSMALTQKVSKDESGTRAATKRWSLAGLLPDTKRSRHRDPRVSSKKNTSALDFLMNSLPPKVQKDSEMAPSAPQYAAEPPRHQSLPPMSYAPPVPPGFQPGSPPHGCPPVNHRAFQYGYRPFASTMGQMPPPPPPPPPRRSQCSKQKCTKNPA